MHAVSTSASEITRTSLFFKVFIGFAFREVITDNAETPQRSWGEAPPYAALCAVLGAAVLGACVRRYHHAIVSR
jgi:hypothetical protein